MCKRVERTETFFASKVAPIFSFLYFDRAKGGRKEKKGDENKTIVIYVITESPIPPSLSTSPGRLVRIRHTICRLPPLLQLQFYSHFFFFFFLQSRIFIFIQYLKGVNDGVRVLNLFYQFMFILIMCDDWKVQAFIVACAPTFSFRTCVFSFFLLRFLHFAVTILSLFPLFDTA